MLPTHFLPLRMTPNKFTPKDVSGTEPEETAVPESQETVLDDPDEISGKKLDVYPAPAKKPSKHPIWTRTINRVTASIWPNDKGDSRHTTAVFRSYFDMKADAWKRVYYYDRADLLDMKIVVDEALAEIDRLNSGGHPA